MCYFEEDGVKNSLPSKLLQKVEEGGNNIVYHYRCAQMGMRFGTAQIPPSLFLSLTPPSATYLHILTICPQVVGRGSGTVQGDLFS